MQLSIRVVNINDFKYILRLLKQLWPDIRLDEYELNTTLQKTINTSSDFAFCTLQGNEIVGFIAGGKFIDYWHAGHTCHVSTLVVDAEFRGKNIGTALLNAVKEWALEEKCRAIELDSAFHREKTHVFYEKYGFQKRAFTFSLDLSELTV